VWKGRSARKVCALVALTAAIMEAYRDRVDLSLGTCERRPEYEAPHPIYTHGYRLMSILSSKGRTDCVDSRRLLK
jgi:hypothetical protein